MINVTFILEILSLGWGCFVTHTQTLSSFTFKSGIWNLLLLDRLDLDVTVFILSHACRFVLSPGAEISQNSDMIQYFPFTPDHCRNTKQLRG